MRSDIRPGGTFPDYALPDHTGTVRTRRELQGRDPMVLTLARGHFYPGLRERWDADDLAPFHGWERRASAVPAGRPAGDRG